MKKGKIVLISVVVIVIVFVGFRIIISGSKEKSKPFETVKVEKKTIVEEAIAIGEITPKNDIEVKSKIPGIVKEKFVEIGDKVEKGDVIVKITPDPTPRELTEARRELEMKKAAFENAKKTYQRRQKLLEKNLISPESFEQAKLQYNQCEISYKLSKDRLSLIEKGNAGGEADKVESVVRAPISGTVLEKSVDIGDPVVPLTSYQPGTPLFTLANMENLIFKGTVDEIDVGKIDVGKKAEIQIGALPGKNIEGEVVRISPKARKENNATVFDIELKITDMRGVNLRAGYSANAKVIINKAENVLSVPERLITFKDDSTYVEVEDTATGKIHKQDIEVGLSDGINAEIKSGVKAGDFIVERPPKEIK
ncbi:MAG: efflux RND transporter periplasmic adaptor subunit [Candidatus Marinimicrobia bacterium]|nr:efflux RND transporter periplasmic adaptor subunit [Candidatus Neomarinimicrobiota bacterium]